ncbi:MAG: response regulator [Bacteroidota bacterium]
MEQEHRPGVLLCEDQEQILELMVLVFEMEGFEVHRARDGEEGLAVLGAAMERIDALVTDLGLPRLEGLELIARARAIKPSLKIIGSSGYGRANVREEVLAAGADDFMGKPIAAKDLVDRVKGLLGL